MAVEDVLRFWCYEASNIRCVREFDYDTALIAIEQSDLANARLAEKLNSAQSELAALREELAESNRLLESVRQDWFDMKSQRDSFQQRLTISEQRNSGQLKLISLIRKTIPAAGMGASWSVDLCDRIDRLINPQPARCVNCDRATVEQCDDAGCGFLGAGNGAPDAKPTESGASE